MKKRRIPSSLKSYVASWRLGGSILSLFLYSQVFSQTTPFSQENAAAILKTLAVEIGPRPMGSPNEQRALRFAVSKFEDYGCDTSYMMPMLVASNVNTNSGVAIGVKKGRTGRIIVIGGHIDTTPDSPGANDDGSGTAVVIELARVLSQRENKSTIYFCCWGGEEVGLEGSKYFVGNFENIDSVALMLQIDMADGKGVLHADPDGSKTSAPSWLVESAFDIFSNELPHTGLDYATEEATWNLAVGGAWGSDHSSFIDKGIPAIDFTSDPTFPIHTPQDRWENFTPSGLKRSGDLVLKLVEKFDAGVPSRTAEKYQLVQFGKNVYFLPYPVLWTFIGIGLASLVVAYIVARRRRLPPDPVTPIKWSRFKLIVAAVVIQTCVWSSESIVGFIKGYRFPWVNNVSGFTILGWLFGAIGVWFVLQAVRKYRLSKDAFVYARLSLFPLLIFTVLTSFLTPELGMFLAATSLAFAVAVIGRKPMFKLLFFVLSFLILYQVVFFDGLGLFQRLLAFNMMSKGWQKVLVHAGFIVLFSALSLPFIHGFAAVYRGSGVDLLWLKKFQRKGGLVVALLGTIAVGGYLLAQPVYDELWFNNVRVEQAYSSVNDSSSISIKGSEFLNGLTGTIDGRDTTLRQAGNYASFIPTSNKSVRWSKVERTSSEPKRISDSTWKIQREIAIRSAFRPFRIDAWYESEQPFGIESPWAHGAKSPDPSQQESDRRKHFRWHFYPDTRIVVPITFTLRDSQHVSERIEVVFDSLAYPIRLAREFTNVAYRTTVTNRDSLSVAR